MLTSDLSAFYDNLKMGGGRSQNYQILFNSSPCSNDTSVKVWLQSIHSSKRYDAKTPCFYNVRPTSCNFENWVNVTKHLSVFASQWCICASLIEIHQSLQEMWFRQAINFFNDALTSCDLENKVNVAPILSFLSISQWYISASLVQFHLSVQKM